MNLIPLITVGFVFLGIALRKTCRVPLSIWQLMLLGALVVLITGQISLQQALQAIDWNILLFLFGAFILGQALTQSGFIAHLGAKLFQHAKSEKQLIFLILFGLGLSAGLLMNDTIAIIGTPMILFLAKRYQTDSKPLLLALATAVTLGSVLSPIGNPQNLLIATRAHLHSPFLTFLRYLSLPTLISLVFAYVLITFFYRKHLKPTVFPIEDQTHVNAPLMRLARLGLGLFVLLIFFSIVLNSFNITLPLPAIALVSACPIVLFYPKRLDLLKKVDWGTLVFFIALFVLMQSVWNTGFFQRLIVESHVTLTHTPIILFISIAVSQVISNVPLVSLYLPLLQHLQATTTSYMALAAGSTLAGHLLVLGAASNVIILHAAEKHGDPGFGFWEFARIGLPLTLITATVYGLFLV